MLIVFNLLVFPKGSWAATHSEFTSAGTSDSSSTSSHGSNPIKNEIPASPSSTTESNASTATKTTTNVTIDEIKRSYLQKQYKNTIQLSQEYLSVFSNDVDASLYEALSYKNLHQCKKAIPIFQSILQSKPQYLDARIGLTGCFLSSREYAHSQEVINSGLDLDPENADLLYLKAKNLTLINKKEDAQKELQQLLKKQPDYTEAKKLLSNLRAEEKEGHPVKKHRHKVSHYHGVQLSDSTRNPKSNVNIDDTKTLQPRFITGIYTDNMIVNVPNQYWNLSNIYGYWNTSKGSFGASVNYTERYHQDAAQLELNATPKLTENVYLDLTYAYANKPQLFANHLESAELYTYFRHGVEGSIGGEHRQIAQYILNSFTGSLGKYVGRYYLNFRPIYFEPGSGPSSILYRLGIRRYGDNPDQFIGLVLLDGTSPDLTDLLTVDFIKVRDRMAFLEGQQPITQRVAFQYGVGYEELYYPNGFLRTLVHFNLGLKVGFM